MVPPRLGIFLHPQPKVPTMTATIPQKTALPENSPPKKLRLKKIPQRRLQNIGNRPRVG
jgi:hypothetical protein